MQKVNWIFCLMISFLAFACSSEDDNGQSEEEINAIKLSGAWQLGAGSSVTRDGVDITGEYTSFLIRFTTSNQYTIQGDPNNVFYPTGTWKFVEGDVSRVQLNTNENPITLTYEDDTHLTLTFTITGDEPIGGRTKGISGAFVFKLSR